MQHEDSAPTTVEQAFAAWQRARKFVVSEVIRARSKRRGAGR